MRSRRPLARPRDLARSLRPLVILALTLAVLVVLVRDLAGTEALARAAAGARPAWVAAAVAAATGCVLVGAQRWRFSLAALGHRISYARSLAVVLATWPPTVVTPSRANELLRPLALRPEVPLAAGTASVVAEKIVDLAVLLVVCVGVALVERAWWLAGLAGAGTAGLFGAVAVLLHSRERWLGLPWIRSRRAAVAAAVEGVGAVVRSARAVAGVAGASLTIRLGSVATVHLLLVAVGAEVSWQQTLVHWPLAVLAGLAPVTLAGMGTRDAAFLFLVRADGGAVSEAELAAATLGYSVVAIWLFALVGLPFMLALGLGGRRPPTPAGAGAAEPPAAD